MTGYWPISFFACLCKHAKKERGQYPAISFVEVHKHAKKELGQYPAILTEQAWSIKDLLYGVKHHNMINIPCGT